LNGTPCGFIKPLGGGSVIHLGTWIGFDTEGHKPVYEEILKRSDAILRQASASGDYLTVRERFTDDNNALLFVGNYYNEKLRGRVTYTHPETGEKVQFPYCSKEIIWPVLYGILTPVCLEVADGLKILHSTSDILSIAEGEGHFEIGLCGDRDLAGEIVFEGPGAMKIRSATIDGGNVEMISDGRRAAFVYSHESGKDLLLKIKFS
jgi:hypothetical protein